MDIPKKVPIIVVKQMLVIDSAGKTVTTAPTSDNQRKTF